jgi:hypothetical protein
MPKQLVIESCLINHGDDRGGVHHDAGEVVAVPKGTAIDLARAGRTLFVDKKDDPDKNGRHTASAEMIKAAADMRKTSAKAAAASDKTDDAGSDQS